MIGNSYLLSLSLPYLPPSMVPNAGDSMGVMLFLIAEGVIELRAWEQICHVDTAYCSSHLSSGSSATLRSDRQCNSTESSQIF